MSLPPSPQAAEAWIAEPPRRDPPDLPHRRLHAGKVRQLYDLGDRLLLVATDRLSAFDVVLGEGIPGKGAILTQISLLGFRRTAGLVPHHLVEPQEEAVAAAGLPDAGWRVRSMVVRRLRPVPMECVVRGFLAGSAVRDYQATGRVQGGRLPAGLRPGDELPEPLFTPSTKAAAGHDEPLTEGAARDLVGVERYEELRAASLALYAAGRAWGRGAGLVLADTKFEFGEDADGTLRVMDEVFTPDSSRWWLEEGRLPGEVPPGFDKQYVRDFLSASPGWDYRAPAPALPREVVAGTARRYGEAWRRLAGAAG